MQKIPGVFMRNHETDRLIRDEVVHGCEWVVNGEGVATRKYDGTACMVRGGRLYKRYDVKRGKTAPDGAEPCQEPDEKTGHWPHWVPVGDGPDDRWSREAVATHIERGDWPLPDGTYELCGPKVQGNAEGMERHCFVRHGAVPMPECPRTFGGMKEWLRGRDVEGVVFHHPDGRMAKVRLKDFGFKRRA